MKKVKGKRASAHVAKKRARKEARAAKIIKREHDKVAGKIEKEQIRAAKLKVKEEVKITKQAKEQAERERYEVKDRGNEGWEDFDVNWEEQLKRI